MDRYGRRPPPFLQQKPSKATVAGAESISDILSMYIRYTFDVC